MTKQRTPHTQTQQNTKPEQTDLEPDQQAYESGQEGGEEEIYRTTDGAESGGDRAPRKVNPRSVQHKTEPAIAAYEGSVSTRTPKRPVQGITSHSADEESKRQEKV